MSVQLYGYLEAQVSLIFFVFMHSFKKFVSNFGDFETLCVRKDSHRKSTTCYMLYYYILLLLYTQKHSCQSL